MTRARRSAILFLPFSGPCRTVSVQVEIPKRALFKAAEVCDLVKVQPYVLRSWEAEFPDLGVTKAAAARGSIGGRMSSRCCGSSICCSSKG